MRGQPPPERISRLLFLSALVIATCGLVYELVAGALASYLLGDSVTQFSFIIGTYLSAMGAGSWASKYIDRALLSRFVEIELAIAIVGGFEAPLLFAAFVYVDAFRFVLFGLVFVIGLLVGLELPLLLRILERHSSLKELVARVLFLDYIGALAASLAFPLLLVPRLGLFRTSLAFGIVNALVALWTTFLFDGGEGGNRTRLRLLAGATLALLIGGFVFSGDAELDLEDKLFADPVVFRAVSPYQRIAVTNYEGDTRLFLNGALQFSTVDEYRYHEALVHPAMTAARHPRRVLVLGGGDGMAVREVLRYDSVTSVTLVDLDPKMTSLFTERPELARLNGRSFSDERVQVINADAFAWLRERRGSGAERFDAVIVDFPDPNNFALGKLYTNHFFRLLKGALAEGAALSIQSTSSFYSPDAYWCIVRTLEFEGYTVRPYHAWIPAFGDWGFALASLGPLPPFTALPEGLRYLDAGTLETLFYWPPDQRRRDGPINRLDNQALVGLYERDWRHVQGI